MDIHIPRALYAVRFKEYQKGPTFLVTDCVDSPYLGYFPYF